MNEIADPVWVKFRDADGVEKRGIIHGYVSRGRGKRAVVGAVVIIKRGFTWVPLGALTQVHAPKRGKRS